MNSDDDIDSDDGNSSPDEEVEPGQESAQGGVSSTNPQKKRKQKPIKRPKLKKPIPVTGQPYDQKGNRSQEYKDWLRGKFIRQCEKYIGIPYAKRYLTPEDELYTSPIFLDCCGLVRRAVNDLKKDFGFKLGPGNQCY